METETISNYRKYPELEPVLEEAGDEALVGVHLNSIPARVRDHHRRHTFQYGIIVSRHVDAQKPMPVDHRVVLVYSPRRPAITNKMLRAPQNLVPDPNKQTIIQFYSQKTTFMHVQRNGGVLSAEVGNSFS